MASSFKWFSLLIAICMGCAPMQNQMVGWKIPSWGSAAAPAGPAVAPPGFESTFTMARAYEAQGNSSRAEEIYKGMLAEYPQNHKLHHRMGVLAVRQGRLEDANKHIDQAIKGAPDDAELLTDIGYTLYLQGKYADAEQKLQAVVADHPDNKRAANNLGMVLARMGHGSDAFRVFRKTGSDAEAHTNLAYAYANIGELELAEQHYSRALDYDDTLVQASDALLQIEEIRRDMESGATLRPVAPLGSPTGTDADGQLAEAAPVPMEDPESPEFASRWRQRAPDRKTAGKTPEGFQFEDVFYESDPSRVTPASHQEVQSNSADEGTIQRASGSDSSNSRKERKAEK